MLASAREGFRAVGAMGDSHMAGLLMAIGAGLLGPAEIIDAVSEEILAEAREAKAPWAILWALWTHGLPWRTDVRDVHGVCLAGQIELGDRWGTTWDVEGKVWRCAATGQFVLSARLMGGAVSLQERHGAQINTMSGFAEQRQKAKDLIIAGIGPEEFEAAYKAGLALTTEEIYQLALEGDNDNAAALSPRQRQIVLLVVEGLGGGGMTNSQVADELSVSVRAVESALTEIYRKLGLRGRTALATWHAGHATRLVTP